MGLWLTEDELVELTGYKRQSDQKRALAELRVQFRSRPADGFPLVARSQFVTTTPTRKAEPNYGAA